MAVPWNASALTLTLSRRERGPEAHNSALPPDAEFWYLTTPHHRQAVPLSGVRVMKSLFVRLAVVGMVAAVALLAIAQGAAKPSVAGRPCRRQCGAGGRRFVPRRCRNRRRRGQSASVGRRLIGIGSPPSEHPLRPAAVDPFARSPFCGGQFAGSACRRARIRRGRRSAFHNAIGPGRKRPGAAAGERADPRGVGDGPTASAAAGPSRRCGRRPLHGAKCCGRRETVSWQRCAAARGKRRAGPVSRRSRGGARLFAGVGSPRADRHGGRRRRRRRWPAGRQAA